MWEARGMGAAAWLIFVLPALALNYFGQGAAILKDPKQIESAFYSVAPEWAHYPMVLLATVATIIASQAVISGVFSITQQAVQLGQLPRMEIRHTSATEYGQIYDHFSVVYQYADGDADSDGKVRALRPAGRWPAQRHRQHRSEQGWAPRYRRYGPGELDGVRHFQLRRPARHAQGLR
jgi:hypothetical protein